MFLTDQAETRWSKYKNFPELENQKIFLVVTKTR